MQHPWLKQAKVCLLVTTVIIGMFLCWSSVRNLLWLMTAGINTDLHAHSLFMYRFVFDLQVFCVGVSLFSITWNVYSFIKRTAKGG